MKKVIKLTESDLTRIVKKVINENDRVYGGRDIKNLYDDLKFYIDEPINDFYNRKSTVAFYALESNGIRICKDKFEEKFHSIHNDTIYTQYNFKTTTTRPSNKFRGVNYSALSKKDDSREAFIPFNDLFGQT